MTDGNDSTVSANNDDVSPSSPSLDEQERIRKVAFSAVRRRKFEATAVLILWPTVPVSSKGSDTRPLDAIRFLTNVAGYPVDLLYWKAHSPARLSTKKWRKKEASYSPYDDSEDRRRLRDAGVRRIWGPTSTEPDGGSGKLPKNTEASSLFGEDESFQYFTVLAWVWPDDRYLNFVTDVVHSLARGNALIQILMAVDDLGASARVLAGACRNQNADGISMNDIREHLLKNRPLHLLGNEQRAPEVTKDIRGSCNARRYRYATKLLWQELYLYSLADVLLGISTQVTDFLTEMVPGVPSLPLSYLATLPPQQLQSKKFAERSDYLFFGFNNYANNAALEWFLDQVLSKVAGSKLHIAGSVTVPSSFCTCIDDACKSLRPSQVICHGTLSTQDLENLVASVRLVINPMQEPSGVGTKTCMAMSRGTPVVASDMDGTFSIFSKANVLGAALCRHTDADCFSRSINDFLTMDETKWNQQSQAAETFISQNYGAREYARNWESILYKLSTLKLNVVVDGDSRRDGESMTAQNWHIANNLHGNELFQVSVVGALEPPIPGVGQAEAPPSDGWFSSTSSVPPFLPTGTSVHLWLRQSWPLVVPKIPRQHCGVSCRIAQILPWEFGALPQQWDEMFRQQMDWLLAPSDFNRRMYGSDMRSSVFPAGVDCSAPESDEDPSVSDDVVRFLFTGGFLPRKGVDILIDEWHATFCTKEFHDGFGSVHLTIHTSYEMGYSTADVQTMKRKLEDCRSSVEWKRKDWMDRAQHKQLMKDSHVYVAPFRSEGFGLPIAEAMVYGKSVIATFGGSSVDDFASVEEHEAYRLYPVGAVEAPCTRYPCTGSKLCVFPPCRRQRCNCLPLVKQPSWLEPNRTELRQRLLEAYHDITEGRTQHRPTRNTHLSVCFSQLNHVYEDRLLEIVGNPMKRSIAEVQLTPSPIDVGLVVAIAVVGVVLACACWRLRRKKMMCFVRHRRCASFLWGKKEIEKLT